MPTHYFRVDGADEQTGEETYLVLQADSKPHAEKIAREQGLLISSVRVAKREDWEAALSPVPDERADEGNAPEAAPKPMDSDAIAIAPKPIEAQPSDIAPTRSAPTGAAAAIVLTFVGAALVIGGVLALALALWPEDASHNELQQLHARLHMLTQCVIGAMLVICGAIALLVAAICYIIPRSIRAS